MKVRSRLAKQAGYSLIELLLVIGIMGVVTSMAVFQIGATVPAVKGDGAMRVVMAQLNTARELAITQRRNMRVAFVNSNQVQVTREEVPGPATTVLAQVSMEGGATFALFPNVPDTPDAFGKGGAIDFGAAGVFKFTPDGMLVDGNGNPLNGTVYMTIPNQAMSVRAVTILGSTGRVRAYRWDSKHWNLV